MPRADHQAMKHIYRTHGLKEVMNWQRQPFIDTSENQPSILDMKTVKLQGAFDLLPWTEFVCFTTDGVRWFAYHLIALHPKHRKEAMNECSGDIIAITSISNDVITGIGRPIYVAGAFDNLSGKTTLPEFPGDDDARQNMMYAFDMVIRVVALDIKYITQSPKHLVEIRPIINGVQRRAAKTARKKPWLRDDLPTTILLDPTEAKEYGHRIDRGGTHASPIPHQRRGHWRQLRSDRYKEKKAVWVKGSWIGDTEWTYNGREYRVVEASG